MHYLETSLRPGLRKCCIKTVPFKIFFKELRTFGERGVKSMEQTFIVAKLSNGRKPIDGLFNERERNEKSEVQTGEKEKEWPGFQYPGEVCPNEKGATEISA